MNIGVPRAVVGALITTFNNRVFLMRSSGKYGSQWIIPGGKIEYGESIVTALKREVHEETNIELTNIRFIGVSELIESERHFIFLEHVAKAKNTENVVLNDEATDYGWFLPNELNSLDIAVPTQKLIARWKKESL